MSRLGCYIDGFNLYHAVQALERPELKWLNLRALANSYRRDGDKLTAAVCFTAVTIIDGVKAKRQREYIRALEHSGVEVVVSRFQRIERFCRRHRRYCDFYAEKETDVALALRILHDALTDAVDRIVLITADSDQLPLIRQVRAARPHVSFEIAAPPGRLRLARELCAASSRFSEVTAGRLRTCLLPRNVVDACGRVVARCPAEYLPPS